MRIGIAGTGTWATALAQVLVDNHHQVVLYGRDQNQIDDINSNHQNKFYFGDKLFLSPKIMATGDIAAMCQDADMIMLCVPTSAVGDVLIKLAPHINKKKIIVNTAKGFDPDSGMRISELIGHHLGKGKILAIVSLLGPSHAEEVILRHLTLITSVSNNLWAARFVQELFANDYFRVYLLKDVIGAELSAAMKNSIAIAAGIIDGLGLGDNAKAALMTRGLNEMVRFGRRFKARPATYLGLTGVGDLVVTCGSKHSRNYQAGFAIGQADSSAVFLKENTKTVEGIRTTITIYQKMRKSNLSLPIIEALYQVLFEGAKPSMTIATLMKRPLKSED